MLALVMLKVLTYMQGEVEQIAMMPPGGEAQDEKNRQSGMLEYLEDIIGSSRFQPVIERVQKQLDTLVLDKQVCLICLPCCCC